MKILEGWIARDKDPVGENQLIFFSDEPEINEWGRWCRKSHEDYCFDLPDILGVNVPAGEKLKTKITIEVEK